MSKVDQQKIIMLQGQLRAARIALEAIANGHSRSPMTLAGEALDRIAELDKTKPPLQGLVGHERRPR